MGGLLFLSTCSSFKGFLLHLQISHGAFFISRSPMAPSPLSDLSNRINPVLHPLIRLNRHTWYPKEQTDEIGWQILNCGFSRIGDFRSEYNRTQIVSSPSWNYLQAHLYLKIVPNVTISLFEHTKLDNLRYNNLSG